MDQHPIQNPKSEIQNRLNPVIARLERGEPAFGCFLQGGSVPDAVWGAGSAYDFVVYEMEHGPFNVSDLRLSLQFMLDRRQIAESGSIAPRVAPLVRVPVNGREHSQWVAKQVLDQGVFGIVFPMVNTPEDAVAALRACRYAQAKGAPDREPVGQRGHSPGNASRYWGLSILDYTDKADVWPTDPDGEVLLCLQCEHIDAVENLEKILDAVDNKPGVILISEKDLSVSMGYRSLLTPEVEDAVKHAAAVCRARGVPFGSPQVTPENVARRLEDGFRFLMPLNPRNMETVTRGRAAAGIA
jgi:4-hydroxy-2-oxoheptanedioate aldolase